MFKIGISYKALFPPRKSLFLSFSRAGPRAVGRGAGTRGRRRVAMEERGEERGRREGERETAIYYSATNSVGVKMHAARV
jgi:hypothetical protein